MSISLNKIKAGQTINIKGTKYTVQGDGDQKSIINNNTGEKAYLINTSRRKLMGTYTATAGNLKGDIDLYIGHAGRVNAVTGETIEIKAKPQRTRQLSKAKTIALDDLPSARDAKVVAQYVKIIRQYRSQQIDAKTMVESLSKDVWQMLRELKEAGHHDPYEILNREDFKKTVDRYGAADSVKFLERLEGYIYGEVSEYNAELAKTKRLTRREA
jgi:hypothetical protein